MLKRLFATLPLIVLGSLLLIPGCRPPEDLDRGGAPKLGELSDSRRGGPPPRQGPGEDGASGDQGGGDGDGVRLSSRGLGKEDYALIEAEIRCVKGQFKDDADALGKAKTSILERYGASEDWVERVRAHLNGEPDVSNRLEEMVERRLGQICVDGTISPELLAGSTAAPAAPEGGGDAPAGDDGAAAPEGTAAPEGEAASEGEAAPAPEGDGASPE